MDEFGPCPLRIAYRGAEVKPRHATVASEVDALGIGPGEPPACLDEPQQALG